MATTINRDHDYFKNPTRTPVQKICLGLGVVFIVLGLAGIMMPGFLGMHLSLAHDIIHLVSGGLAIWAGNSRHPRRAYYFCLAFGLVFGFLGLAGFLIGTPGYPSVGNMEADQNLFRMVPEVLEFGTVDHIAHVLFSAVLLFSAYASKRSSREAGRFTVDAQAGTRDLNPERGSNIDHRNMYVREKDGRLNIHDADLGNIDMRPEVDRKRREEFERRL